MRIRIDVDACQGHNRCAMTYPEIFDVHDDVKAFVHVDQIPREWEERALLAIANCPERAISISE